MIEQRKREKRNLTLDPEANAALEYVGNASEYVSRVVAQRAREWRDALAIAKAAGWTKPMVFAAADALNGSIEMLASHAPPWLAMELEDAARLNGLCEKWDVPPKRWADLVREVAESHEGAWAMRVLAREIWAGNEGCEAAIERLGVMTMGRDRKPSQVSP